MRTGKLVFPHQLFQYSPLFVADGPFYMLEEYLFFRQYKFHKQKIAFHRASMKFYESYLLKLGHVVNYIQATDPESDIRVLLAHLKRSGIEQIAIVDPVDDWLFRRIRNACKKLHLKICVYESPLFLNDSKDLEPFFKASAKTFFQTAFYKQERIRRNILLEDSVLKKPFGGKWTFDEENRKRYPKGKPIVSAVLPVTDAFYEEARDYTNHWFSGHLGQLNSACNYPNTFDAAEAWLMQFLRTRLAEFGDYEDAIVHSEYLLNHSLLTPMLNVGLLTPAWVLEKVMAYAALHTVPLNSLEGFVRQLIGWREFIRGVYAAKGREARTRNFWGFTRKIPPSFYDGSTGIYPVDATIRKVLINGYCHHIERLMVLGNFMLLCGFHPDEVYRWFMEMFIDAYDWVMVPNVYGMSQFADGGIMSTKPYISGSNYLMKMGDYPKGEWQEVWDALFWRFMDKQRIFFMQNPRLGMLLKTYDKWPEEKKKAIHQKANLYLAGLDQDNLT